MSKVKSNKSRTKCSYHFKILKKLLCLAGFFKIKLHKSHALASEEIHKFIAAENLDLCMTKVELD